MVSLALLRRVTLIVIKKSLNNLGKCQAFNLLEVQKIIYNYKKWKDLLFLFEIFEVSW